jgi:hypothetical protein
MVSQDNIILKGSFAAGHDIMTESAISVQGVITWLITVYGYG